MSAIALIPFASAGVRARPSVKLLGADRRPFRLSVVTGAAMRRLGLVRRSGNAFRKSARAAAGEVDWLQRAYTVAYPVYILVYLAAAGSAVISGRPSTTQGIG